MFLKSRGKSGWDLTSKKKKYWSVFHNILTRYPLTTTKTPLPKTQFNSTNIYSGPTIKCAQEGKLSLVLNPCPVRWEEHQFLRRGSDLSLGLLFISWNNSSAFSPSISYLPEYFEFTLQNSYLNNDYGSKVEMGTSNKANSPNRTKDIICTHIDSTTTSRNITRKWDKTFDGSSVPGTVLDI